jgi:hypothetical protein
LLLFTDWLTGMPEADTAPLLRSLYWVEPPVLPVPSWTSTGTLNALPPMPLKEAWAVWPTSSAANARVQAALGFMRIAGYLLTIQ